MILILLFLACIFGSVFIFPKIFSRISQYMLSKLSFLNGLLSNSLKLSYSFFRSNSIYQKLSRVLQKNKIPYNLPPVSNFEKVSDYSFRILAQNPGYHTLQGSNTYLITGDNPFGHILVDTGESGTSSLYIDILFNQVFPKSNTKGLSKIILTHGHADHQGGVLAILNELKKRKMTPLPLIYKHNIPNGNYPTNGFEAIQIENYDRFQIDDGPTLHAIYTPGHTDDHICLLIEEDNAIITGDTILGSGTSVFDDLFSYLNSLKTIRQLITEGDKGNSFKINCIYPGHGPIISHNPLIKVDEYISHRILREEQILKMLQVYHESTSDPWISSLQLVPLVYGKLPYGIFLSAQANLIHHLEKLSKEKRVNSKWPDLWKLV